MGGEMVRTAMASCTGGRAAQHGGRGGVEWGGVGASTHPAASSCQLNLPRQGRCPRRHPAGCSHAVAAVPMVPTWCPHRSERPSSP